MGEKIVGCTLTENFEFLFNEICSQQKEQQKASNDLVNAVNVSTNKIDNLNNKIGDILSANVEHFEQALQKELHDLKEMNRQIDTTSLKEAFKNGIMELKLILSTQQKPNVKKFQILLFPEQDAKLFYKIVFGRWYLMIVIALFLHLAYKAIDRQQEINRQVRIEEVKASRTIKAWNHLYSQKNRTLRGLMDRALKKTNDDFLTLPEYKTK